MLILNVTPAKCFLKTWGTVTNETHPVNQLKINLVNLQMVSYKEHPREAECFTSVLN